MQSGAHAGSDQDIDCGQRCRQSVIAGVKAFFDGEFGQPLFGNGTVFYVVNPEFPAFSGVFGDGFSVLTGNGYLHDVSGG